MTTAYLSLGSNLGDRLAYLASAARMLTDAHTRLNRVSSVYETAPQGKTDQPAFLNAVLSVETDLTPELLLQHIQAVELSLGRVRTERWGPRTLDVDILLYGTETIERPGLQVPHPRMAERAFVLVPLLEIGPQLPYSEALGALHDQGIGRFLSAEAFLERIYRVQ